MDGKMKVTFLGTGTSHGIPVIACKCPVCTSSDPRDRRYRSSLLVETGSTSIVIDTGYEFRLSMIRAGATKLDAILYTHSHSDHLMGLDDVRVFTKDRVLPVYGNSGTLEDVVSKFPYAFRRVECPKGIPQLEAHPLEPCVEAMIGDIPVIPVPLMHYKLPIYGYRFGDFAYLTDVSHIPQAGMDVLKGVRILVLGALRERPHIAHLSFGEAADIARKLNVEKCYFTHINHETGYNEINRRYEPLCSSAYDNMVLEV